MQERNRINRDGELVLTSQRNRTQLYVKRGGNLPNCYDGLRWADDACRGNIEDALEKLQDILDQAWKSVQPIEEDPEKKKQIDTQKKRGNETRLKSKKMKSDKKKERRKKIDW